MPSGRYRARFETRDGVESGETHRTIKEAKIWLGKQKAAAHEGRLPNMRAGRIKVGVYADGWLEQHIGLRPRTRDTYASLVKRHIKPTFGEIELRRISAPQVRAWHSDLVKSMGQSTAAKAYRLLRTMLNTAVEDGILLATPCVVKGAGVERPEERPIATVEQVDAVTAAMAPELRAMVPLGTWCALRLSEILALTRERVDLEAATLMVVGGAHEVSKLGRVLEPPKSAAGRRPVAIPPHVIGELQRHMDTYVGAEPEAWLFTGPGGGPLRRASFYTAWGDAKKAVTLPSGFRFHDLRHTGNTAAAPHASTKELMARHGHSSPRAAMIYQHSSAERDRAIAVAISATVEEARAKAKTNSEPVAHVPVIVDDVRPAAAS